MIFVNLVDMVLSSSTICLLVSPYRPFNFNLSLSLFGNLFLKVPLVVLALDLVL